MFSAIHTHKAPLVKSNTPFFQAKLTVNEPGDEYEQEADAVADKVMRMAAPATISPSNPPDENKNKIQLKPIPFSQIFRKCADCEEEEKVHRKESTGGGGQTAPPIVNEVISSNGKSLDGNTQQFMESRMGHDFSHVQVHTDGKAAESAASVNALAYTSGNHVVFGSGQYQPNTEGGKRLLAHELVHVGQQEGEGKSIQREKDERLGKVGDATDVVGGGLEKAIKEAEEAAKRLAEEAKEMTRKPAAKYRKAKRKQKKPTKAKNALKDARKAAKVVRAEAEAVSKLAKAAKGFGYGLDALGFGVEYYDKAFGDNSPAQTTLGKQADALSSAGLNTAFGVAHPYAAAADALQEYVFDGHKPIPISDTVSGSTSAISSVGESFLTGDTAGISEFHDRSKSGDYGWIMEEASEAGEWWADEGGGAERAQMVGDFYGGSDTVTGRVGGFVGAVPLVSHAGEFLGESAAKGYLAAEEAVGDVKAFAEENWTTDPDEIDLGRTFSPWDW